MSLKKNNLPKEKKLRTFTALNGDKIQANVTNWIKSKKITDENCETFHKQLLRNEFFVTQRVKQSECIFTDDTFNTVVQDNVNDLLRRDSTWEEYMNAERGDYRFPILSSNWSTYFTPQYQLEHKRVTEVLFKVEDRLILTRYSFNRVKPEGKLFTTTERVNTSVTFNSKTGCFYNTITTNKGASQRKRITKKNQFRELIKILSENYSYKAIVLLLEKLIVDKLFKTHHQELYNKFIGFKYKPVENTFKIEETDDRFKYFVLEIVVAWFVEHHGIKATNNYYLNFVNNYITLRHIKRSNNNLTDSLCKIYKLSGKTIKKKINQNDSIDFGKVKFFHSILHRDYFNKIDNNLLIKQHRVHNMLLDVDINRCEVLAFHKDTLLTFSEQNKIINIIGEISDSDIYDHIVMRDTIFKKMNRFVKMNFRNAQEFRSEHALFSTLTGECKKDYTVKLEYPEEMVEAIEKPIIVPIENEAGEIEELEFKSFLLTSTEDHLEEGMYQSHCVGSMNYVERKQAIIISLRKDNIRMTSEFNSDNGNYLQNRMAFNHLPKNEWEKAKDEINSRIKRLFERGVLKPKEITKIPLKSNDSILNEMESEQNVRYVGINFDCLPKKKERAKQKTMNPDVQSVENNDEILDLLF